MIRDNVEIDGPVFGVAMGVKREEGGYALVARWIRDFI